MARWSRIRHAVKWVATLGSVVLVMIAVITCWAWTSFVTESHSWVLGVQVGAVTVVHAKPAGFLPHLERGLAFRWTQFSFDDWSQFALWPKYDWRSRIRHASVPLWLPLVIMAVPTGTLWWLDRRRIPPGHCQKCGYNLTGNVSGRCPECGEPAAQPSEALT
jgi:hypothetical protein